MSATEEWSRRQLIQDDNERYVRAYRMQREYEQRMAYNKLSWWGKLWHNIWGTV